MSNEENSTKEEVVEELISVKEKLAKVYKDEASDDLTDNGNLINIHQAIIHIENAIQIVKKR